MSVISVETKKFAELEAILEAADDNTLLIHDDNGVKTITFANLKKVLQASIDTIEDVLRDGADAHNSIYRGKYLGSAVTDAQYAAIADGTFEDLYIGDYWTIGGVNYRIAAFDYYLTTGNTVCSKHHAVIVPDTNLYSAQMNTSAVTTGAYVGSAMYTANLADAKTTIKAAFSGHILSHRQYLKNAVTNGYESAGAWYDSEIELMTEQNVYGGIVFAHTSSGTNIPASYTIDKSQYPLFTLAPHMQSNRQTYWLRDVVSSATFAHVNYDGYCSSSGAPASYGVRPAFCIC